MKPFALLAVAALLVLVGCAEVSAGPEVVGGEATPTATLAPDMPVIPEGECMELVWFDGTTAVCDVKEFCGAYMYQSLRTFESLNDCEDGLYERSLL